MGFEESPSEAEIRGVFDSGEEGRRSRLREAAVVESTLGEGSGRLPDEEEPNPPLEELEKIRGLIEETRVFDREV
jgi:hypothetical protein